MVSETMQRLTFLLDFLDHLDFQNGAVNLSMSFSSCHSGVEPSHWDAALGSLRCPHFLHRI